MKGGVVAALLLLNILAPCRTLDSRILQDGGGAAIPFVLNGEDAPEGRFPYACSLRFFGSRAHGCGGVLVAKRWVLTAAHCVTGPESVGSQPIVYVGAYGIDDTQAAEIIRSLGSYFPDEWNGDVEAGNDIALVHLEKESTRQPIFMAGADFGLGIGQLLTTIGWVRRSSTQALASVLTMANGLEYVGPSNCKNAWPQLKNDMICAHSTSQRTCGGDSGGPLIVADLNGSPNFDLLVGIVSFGPKDCGQTKEGRFKPGVYATVGYFRDWINNIMNEETNEGEAGPPTAQVATANVAAFLAAAGDGDLETVKSELAAGVDIESRNSRERTALYLATIEGSVGVATFLLDNGANIEAKDDIGWTPLHSAAFNGNVEVARLLLERGADVNAAADNDITPLHRAAQNSGGAAIITVLVNAGANIDAQSNRGLTPLHFAARNGHKRNVEKLVDLGADKSLKNQYGDTPADNVCICLIWSNSCCCNANVCNNSKMELLELLE